MQPKSSRDPRQVVRWHAAPSQPTSPRSTERPAPPSRGQLGLLAKTRAWLGAKVQALGRRQVRALATGAGPASAASPVSPASSIPPLSPASPASPASAASPHSAAHSRSVPPALEALSPRSPASFTWPRIRSFFSPAGRAAAPATPEPASPAGTGATFGRSPASAGATPSAAAAALEASAAPGADSSRSPTPTPVLSRYEARSAGPGVLAQTEAALAQDMAEGMNETLARCNAGLASTPADQTHLSDQSTRDWHRSWRIAFEVPGGGLRDLVFGADGSARLRNRATGASVPVDLRPGRSPSSVAHLAAALDVSPTRLLRVCSLLAQTELAPAEVAIGRKSPLSAAFGAGFTISLLGGEGIAATARFGAGDEDDRLLYQFDRGGPAFRALSAMSPELDSTLVELDTEHSFLHWQLEARIDAAGRAHVDPASVRLDYSLVVAPQAD